MNKKQVFKDKISTLLTIILVALLLYKGFDYYQLQKQQGETAAAAMLTDLQNNPTQLSFEKKQTLVFWATWCGPCSVELGRINAMIEKGDLAADSVLAISIKEDPSIVAKFVAEKKYKFRVALDLSGQVAQDYKIRGTPTVYLIDEHQKVRWVSVGISPSLEFRLTDFFKN